MTLSNVIDGVIFMPILARLDAHGALHHIIIRGIEHSNIFRDNKDRDNFIDRLSDLLPATQTPVMLGPLSQTMHIFYSEAAAKNQF